MGAEKPRENELEQELDDLYRKVAGLDQPVEIDNRTVSRRAGKRPATANTQKPITACPVQTKRRRLHTAILGWGLIFSLLLLAAIGFFGRESLRPSVDNRIIAPPAQGAKGQGVAPLPAEENGMVITEPPVDDPPTDSRQARYAIQLRAYPGNQKQNAILFLEDLRKRSPDVTMETVGVAESGIWHRILLGDFSTVDEAVEYRNNDSLAQENPYSFIQRKLANGP
jgi:hypothetical protein